MSEHGERTSERGGVALAAPRQPEEFTVVVTRKEPLADGVVGLTLSRPDGTLPEWTPGAHIDLLLGAGAPGGPPDGAPIRQYSLCGDPRDRTSWQVAVLRELQSRGGSAYVHDRLTAGTRIGVRGPRNNFPLLPAPRYLFIAGGIGITPLLPMIGAADAAGADWRLLYGGRTRASMAFRERLAAYGDRVAIRPEDETGLLDLAGFLGERAPGTLVYCCGPEPLLAAAERQCAEPGTLHVERFRPTEPAAGAGEDTAFEVVLARSGLTLPVPPGTSILEVVEAAGVQVLSSCREGTCGTCETDLLEGEADHRDVLLTPDERAANESLMICVSRARCPRLVLDL